MNKHASAIVAILLGCASLSWASKKDVVLHVVTEDHPHVRALRDGKVDMPCCELRYSTGSLKTSEARQPAPNPLPDVIEVDFVSYMKRLAAGNASGYVLIPVFPSRKFQMRNVYIRTDRGIREPQDLRGKTVGVDGDAETTSTWLRGVLLSSYSVKADEIVWLDTKTSTGPAFDLAQGLMSGKVDAIFSPTPPKAYLEKNPLVARLFEDYVAREQKAFRGSRIFPIETALAVKKSLIETHPWLPEALFLAFSKAKEMAYDDLTIPLPWGGDQLTETQAIMGKNFWSYGIKSNPKTLGALFSLANSQGLLAKKVSIKDVFEPSTLLLLEP